MWSIFLPKFHIARSNGSLVVTFKMKAEENMHMVAMLLFYI
jgi:hypothetical protein